MLRNVLTSSRTVLRNYHYRIIAAMLPYDMQRVFLRIAAEASSKPGCDNHAGLSETRAEEVRASLDADTSVASLDSLERAGLISRREELTPDDTVIVTDFGEWVASRHAAARHGTGAADATAPARAGVRD